jgi:Ion transport protein
LTPGQRRFVTEFDLKKGTSRPLDGLRSPLMLPRSVRPTSGRMPESIWQVSKLPGAFAAPGRPFGRALRGPQGRGGSAEWEPNTGQMSGSERSVGGREDLKGTVYEFFILAVSILSIVNMILLAAFTWENQYWWLVAWTDVALTVIFIVDFAYRLRTASSKWGYIRHGGVFDLLACVPALRIFRLFRIYRAVKIIRRLGGPRVISELREQFASGTLYLVIFLGLLTLEVVGLFELFFEQDAPGANITTGGDALWWGYVTATTVGYGDKYPITTGGRIFGFAMLTIGVALFATFSGFLANVFLSKRKGDPEPRSEAKLGRHDLERMLEEQRALTQALQSHLAALD